MAKTAKPTGLKISRDKSKFALSWKKGDSNYDGGQNFAYRINGGSWVSVSVGKKDTSKAVTLSASNYYPNTSLIFSRLDMRVRGKRSGRKMSSWASKAYTIKPPKMPTLTATMHDTQWNVCTFAWAVETSDTDEFWFNDVEWQTILVNESNVTDGSELTWDETQDGYDTGTDVNNSSKAITEDSFTLADGSYTRWFRVRARGAAGNSGWRYEKHVYALSYQAAIESAVATVQPTGGFQCRVVWEAPASPSHPIDATTVQYAITVPDENLTCPDEASWTDARISADTEGSDAVVFPIDRLLSYDQCLFVRVNTAHDGVMTYGLPKLVEGGVGVLSDPTLTSVVLGDNYMVTINATNNSQVEDSYLVILYRPASNPASEIAIGTIPFGQTTKSVQAPDWSGEDAYAFGVYAAVGNEETITQDNALMKSSIEWGTGDVPKAPANVTVSATSISGTVRVEWDWTWAEATGAELSWADHEDAWESTDEPERYEISSIYNSRWNISGLETGIKWYVKVRLKKGTGDNETYGPYSETAVIDLTSAPSVPTLVLSSAVITENGSVTASWVYTTTDGTAQTYAEICEAEITSEGIEYGDIIAHTETAQHVTINAQEAGWQTGETYNLCVRVVSASGRVSDEWSAPVAIMIAEPLTIEITDTSLVTMTEDGRTFLALTEMPLEIELSEADVTVAIERAQSYHIDRPDETSFDGFERETIALKEGSVEAVDVSDLIGSLDDGALYRIVATVKDDLGQSAEASLDFEVRWAHQAVVPDGTVEIDSENYIAKLTPVAPLFAKVGNPVDEDIETYYELIDGEYVLTTDIEVDEDKTYYAEAVVEETDVCDIYRLSADRPQLVIQGGQFGETYVDPFPTLGQSGGYRFVFRTANGDYITEANELAWVDIDEVLEIDYTIIDFDGGQIMLHYNVDVSSSWAKDFQETKYLGGSVQGDWNPAVSRTSNISAVTITITDEDEIEMIRRLAVSPSICHVRTRDGSSYSADIQVSEDYSHDKRGKIGSYTFSITRVDAEGLDGMTLAQWEAMNDELE